jgi:hypothetical protein
VSEKKKITTIDIIARNVKGKKIHSFTNFAKQFAKHRSSLQALNELGL